MSRIEVKLPPVPSELKFIAPFTSRAQELSGKEPVIAYYCLYHAVQSGMCSAKAKEKDPNIFLNDLMTALESMKDQLKGRREVTSDEAAATYIENFALKVFANADNEDRKGGSNRSTAKKFLAASNFFELLSIFDAKYLNPLIQPEEKIKYAKWKAADIAKAYREGRVPQSGPATTLDGFEDELAELHASSHSEIEDASMGSSAGAAAFEPSDLKPSPLTKESSSTPTVAPGRNTGEFTTPRHISTASTAPSSYVVDLSSPTSGPKTPLKSPGISDGMWSTAATPGIDSQNVFPGLPGASGGKPALNYLSPASLALLNSGLGAGKKNGGDSPLSPGASLKPRSGLGASVFTAGDIGGTNALRKQGDEEGIDTDEEDGTWSTAGNDPFSRQNTMAPPSSGTSFNTSHAPALTVTSSLGAVQEEVSPQSTPQKPSRNNRSQHNLVAPNALIAPLPSASNTTPPSPDARPDTATFAASHPLPPALPPSTQAPSSIKSESHVLPEDSPNKNYKFTSSVVGDSTSDGEVGYNYRRRANSASPGQAPTSSMLSVGDKSGMHVRSSSVNNASVHVPPASTSTNDTKGVSAAGKAGSSSSAEDDWEKNSLSRLARLPDSVTGSDLDALSGRLRDLGASESESTTPTIPGTSGDSSSDFKSRRNTIKARAPPDERLSGSDFGFSLPGVPSAPPGGDWGTGHGNGGGSDSGGEGDVMAKLPSAPAAPPLGLDQRPHVAVYKPSTPREELHVNPHFLPPPPPPPLGNASAPSSHDLESPSTPRSRSHSRTPSVTSSEPHVPSNTGSHPPPFGYGQSPASATISNSGQAIHRGYTPPNSVVSPHQHFGNSIVQPTFIPTLPAGHFAPAAMPPSAYGNNVQMNGTTDEFGFPISTRPPPDELDPETVGKAQKHTKFALSALNFDDLHTARNELKKALLLLS